MDTLQLQIAAGAVSTMMFVSSSIPMVYKAFKTKDMKSYSLENIVISNLGNLLHWIYVTSLPVGPIWFLHGFNTLVAAFMLFWYFRYKYSERVAARQVNLVKNILCECGCAEAVLDRNPNSDGGQKIRVTRIQKEFIYDRALFAEWT